ncbi:MAG: PH domain-containing protein [Phycisphaerales bacterium]|nr:PH domain-containing protein [Phycisphaerales bacterium]MCB9863886.1 PH domain-containing protein [Phycisphaerales bacterium]
MKRDPHNLGRFDRRIPVHNEGASSGVMEMPLTAVPAQLLDGGETVYFAVKPSAWFVLIVSARWLAAAFVLGVLSYTVIPSQYSWYASQAAILMAAGRLSWATFEWVARIYVLTNRRVMRIRGVMSADIFAAPLHTIERADVFATPGERALRVGSVGFESATMGRGAWEIVARPVEMHERLQHAIRRARGGGNGIG